MAVISIVKEKAEGECRVAASPQMVGKLIKLGFKVIIESGAGTGASFPDEAFAEAGAEITANHSELYGADILFKVDPPTDAEIQQMKTGGALISFIRPAQHPELMDALAAKGGTVLAMDCVPRMSRAQKMDALSSMANIAGYRAVIEAAHHFGRFFTGQVTAAGKIPPAKVFVIGAGVAGLAAIGAAAGLGAIVRGNDTRAEVGDQVRSLGAEFVPVEYEEEGSGTGGYAKVMSEGFQKAQRALFAKQAKEVDVIITTALIPGKPAPVLITEEMVKSMKPGSVIVDLAAENGGNCELTEKNKAVVKHGVTIIGFTDLPSRLAKQSSTLYANNLLHLTEELCKEKDGELHINMEDAVIRGATVIKDGNITWPPPAPKLSAAPAKPAAAPAPVAEPEKKKASGTGRFVAYGLGAVVLALAGAFAPMDFLGHFTVFVLACFVGYMVVWNVTSSLHTPLMSVTNAISSIITIGALIQIAPPLADGTVRPNELIRWIAFAGIALTAINMFGGFAVTRRMLLMFNK